MGFFVFGNWDARFEMRGSRFKVQGSRFKVQGSRFKVQGSSMLFFQSNNQVKPNK